MSGDVAKEIVEEYISSLSELTNNSKPLINMLTILAEDYIDHAPAIVEAVEAHLHKVSSEIKLPVLYLIDSIIKNVNKAYLGLFSKNIVNSFCHVFEKVDETTRVSMWNLRTTWKEVFSTKKLYSLDVRVQKIDPAWPMTLKPPTGSKSSHGSSKSSEKSKQKSQSTSLVTKVPPVQPTATVPPTVVAPKPGVKLSPLSKPPATASEAEMQQELLKKQKLLLELQKQKLDLELMQAKANLEQQRKQLDEQSTLLKPELSGSPEGPLETSTTAASTSSSISNLFEKQSNASSLFKTENKTGVRIAPASSIAVAAAKQSRDPRLKLSATSTESIEEIAKQQILQHLKLHMQNKRNVDQSSLLNNASKGISESEVPTINNKSLDNKRAKDSNQKKEPITSTLDMTSNIATAQLNNNVIKDSLKSSLAKSSSIRNSSLSKTASSSLSPRKSGSKSRSKRPSSPSPTKITQLDESMSPPAEKRSKKLSSKSRKAHSPSPLSPGATSSNGNSSGSNSSSSSSGVGVGSGSSYRIPRRSAVQEVINVSPTSNNTGGLSNGSAKPMLLDDDEPPTSTTSFKDIRASARHRNYIRRNKEGSRSPDSDVEEANKVPDASKDEDLRAPIVSISETKDLDFRVLALPGGKRLNAESSDASVSKKSKTDRFDALFGSEDVDLRTLTNPKVGLPQTSPTSHASSNDKAKDSGWAKLKTPVKTERETSTPKPLTDRNRDRLGRPRLYSKTGTPDDPRDRRLRVPPISREFDKQNERNIEIIMKQAAEQLNQGEITKSQYNTLIQEVLQMSEDQKLRAAQRKEQELGMLVWEKGDGAAAGSSFAAGNEENTRDHSAPPPRAGNNRWTGPWHQPWGHPPPPHGPFPPNGPPPPFPPPGGPDGFRPMAPWQNHPRMFGPIRSEMHQPPPFPPFNSRMGPPPMFMGNGPMMGPSGSINNLPPMSQMPPGMMTPMGNGPVRSDIQTNRSSPSGPSSGTLPSSGATVINGSQSETDITNLSFTGPSTSGELPEADPALVEEITKDTMKSINIDNVPREIRYYGTLGIVFMNWDDPRDIGFQDGTRRIFINGKDSILCNFNDDYKEFTYEGEIHRIKLGTPTRELYVDDKWYECYFGGRPIPVELGNKTVNVNLEGPPPVVKIGTVKRTDLVIGKINLIINARNMVPVFLDAKPQMFEVEGKPCTLEFADSLQTVLLNGRPFRVEFGGLPKPVIFEGKKHFIRFSVLPRGMRAGYVKITGMRGEQPKEPTAAANKTLASSTSETSNQRLETAVTTAPATIASSLAVPLSAVTSAAAKTNSIPASLLDHDSTSQDGMDTSSVSKSGLQLDLLSSVVPSAMAPSSGQSYQAEPAENPPAPAPTFSLPTNVSELFQRLVEAGIVPSLDTSKKPEEKKKEPEIIPVTFHNPETLKKKQPAVVTLLYTGMQCSSCGERFAPEMATRYSDHLDWHFRQNRKERDAAKRAQSRAWYYEMSDWTQFEEIEYLEDRAQSWFETEKQGVDTEGMPGDNSPSEEQISSVRAGTEADSFCEVCHEAFEQFFDEDKEEWHYKRAVTFENKNFHPSCLEDHKRALEKSAMALEETIAEIEGEAKPEELHVEIEIKEEPLEEKPVIKEEEMEEDKTVVENNPQPEELIKEIKKEEEPMADDDDLIEVIEPIPKKIEFEEIVDSDDDMTTMIKTEDSLDITEHKPKEFLIEKIEEKIPDDMPLIFENVKIKQEPLDDPEPEESIAETSKVDTTQVAVKSSIDGNVELESATPAIQNKGPSRIKINITKTLNSASRDLEDSKVKVKKCIDSPVENPTPAKPMIPAAIKSSLQGKKLSILPTVEKGHELSALCSIM